jgi:3'(2'), 5'-bisphosphate nucleotidase
MYNNDTQKYLSQLSRKAGNIILDARNQSKNWFQHKSDGSPVTQADHDAQTLILDGLLNLTPDIPVIAEEKTNDAALTASGTYWLVDPIDGTREYVSGRDEFTVNIGLLVEHQPILGLLYAPALDDLFYAEPGQIWRERAGLRQSMNTVSQIGQPLRLITSKREARRLPVQDWLAEGLIDEWRVCSSAYKFGLLAAGDYNCFLRTGTTYEWDTAAGDALLRAVGGKVMTLDTTPLVYSKPNFRNGNFIATLPGVGQAALDRLLERVKASL